MRVAKKLLQIWENATKYKTKHKQFPLPFPTTNHTIRFNGTIDFRKPLMQSPQCKFIKMCDFGCFLFYCLFFQ